MVAACCGRCGVQVTFLFYVLTRTFFDTSPGQYLKFCLEKACIKENTVLTVLPGIHTTDWKPTEENISGMGRLSLPFTLVCSVPLIEEEDNTEYCVKPIVKTY